MDLPPERQAEVGAPVIPEHIRQRMAAAQAAWRLNGMVRPFGRNRSQQLQETSKRQRTSGPETQTTMMDSAAVVFKFTVDYEQTKRLSVGKAVHSDAVSAGGHTWRINCYPRGRLEPVNGDYLSIYVELLSKSSSLKAVFEAFVITSKGGETVLTSPPKAGVHEFQMGGDRFGWDTFMPLAYLVKQFVTDGQITFLCSIMVLEDNSTIPVPPSDIGKNLGSLLDSTDGADVSFTIDGETFHAHRAVLAARSEVFRAELLGSMAESTMPSITLHDIAPATFRAMLRFMYTDALPGNEELAEDCPTKMFESLLAAADRYALDRLKLMCAQKLWDGVSVDTVAGALACAEIYNCPELKNKCIDFVAAEKNFKKAVLTEIFMELGHKFPSIVAEVRKRVGA